MLDRLAALLIENETIERDEFEALFEGVLPPREGRPTPRRGAAAEPEGGGTRGGGARRRAAAEATPRPGSPAGVALDSHRSDRGLAHREPGLCPCRQYHAPGTIGT